MEGTSFLRRYRWHWAGDRPQLFVASVVVLAGVNWLGGLIVNTLKLPIFGDMMGTILAGALFGPVGGAITGVLTNLGGAVYNPILPWFVLTAALVGFYSGLAAGAGALSRPWRALIAGAGLGLLSAAISAPVVAALTAGATPSGLYSAIVAMARSQGVSVWGSTYVASLTTDPLDKALSFLIVSVVLIGLPKRLRQRFPGPTKLGLGGVATGARSDSDEVR